MMNILPQPRLLVSPHHIRRLLFAMASVSARVSELGCPADTDQEIINFPDLNQMQPRILSFTRIKEDDIVFKSHISGFVYKVNVNGKPYIKKEIPGPDTVEHFVYELNALCALRNSLNVLGLYGVVVDEHGKYVKGLLTNYASQGALGNIIYENCKKNNTGLSWATKERWAQQIVQGLADVHDSGFIQGDLTLFNILIDDANNAKFFGINMGSCPVGWEPPEAMALINARNSITMHIGVKSDLYQLGMVLWGLAIGEDNPGTCKRPLKLGSEINVPEWYRNITETCLNPEPRMRSEASTLLRTFSRPTTIDDCTPKSAPFGG